MSDLSTASNDEETNGSSPVRPTEESTAIVKIICAASPASPTVGGGATPPPWYPGYPWSEVPQCLPVPEGRNSLALRYDSQLLQLPLLHLRSQRPEEAFTVNLGQNALTSPESPPPPHSPYFKQVLIQLMFS